MNIFLRNESRNEYSRTCLKRSTGSGMWGFQLLPYPRLPKPHYLRKNASCNMAARYAKRPKLRGLVQSSIKFANGFISLQVNEKDRTVQRSDTKSTLNLTRILHLKTTAFAYPVTDKLYSILIKDLWSFRSVSHQKQASLILLIMVRHHRFPVLRESLSYDETFFF